MVTPVVVKPISSTANTVTIKKDHFNALVNQNNGTLADINFAINRISGLLMQFGMIDKKTGAFKKGGMKNIMMNVGTIMSGLMSDDDDMKGEFAGIKELVPLIEKYKPEQDATAAE